MDSINWAFVGEGGAHIVIKPIFDDQNGKNSKKISEIETNFEENIFNTSLACLIYKVCKSADGVSARYYLSHRKLVEAWFAGRYLPALELRPLVEEECLHDDKAGVEVEIISESFTSSALSSIYTYSCSSALSRLGNSISKKIVHNAIESISSHRSKTRKAGKEINFGDFIICEEDAFAIQSNSRDATCVATFSLELKVKCGLKNCSPFATGIRSIKKKLSRFQLMQIEKSGSVPPIAISYDPCDLCSMDLKRIRRALDALSTIPNKYFRKSFGENQDFRLKQFYERMKINLCDSSCLSREFHEKMQSCIDIEIAARILSNENCCFLLERLQSLDFIDLEGCEIVYNRLKLNFGWSFERISIEIEKSLEVEGFVDNLKQFVDFLSKMNSNFPVDFASLSEVPGVLYQVYSCSYTNSEKTWYSKLSSNACVDILSMWLLALMAKDASVAVSIGSLEERSFACLSPSDSEDQISDYQLFYEEIHDERKFRLKLYSKISTISLQETSKSGAMICDFILCVSCGIKDFDENHLFHFSLSCNYQLKLIDSGPKPVKKLLSKFASEDSICSIASEIFLNSEIGTP